MSLLPTAIVAADYGVAQRPHLGGEIQVYACTAAAGIRKKVKNLGGGLYETRVYNSTGFGGVVAVAVGDQGLHGSISGIIEPPLWAVNQSTNYPVGKAGVGSIPGTFGSRGDELFEVDIPDYDPAANPPVWIEVGCTTQKNITFPVRMSKAISCGMVSANWVVPGKTTIGELTITAKNSGHEEGLGKIAGLKSTIMLKFVHENVLEVSRMFLLEFTPDLASNNPDADGEAEVTAKGLFSRFAFFSAPGT